MTKNSGGVVAYLGHSQYRSKREESIAYKTVAIVTQTHGSKRYTAILYKSNEEQNFIAFSITENLSFPNLFRLS